MQDGPAELTDSTAAAGATGETGRTARREMGRRALLFLSVGAVIGSGWLFASLDAATKTGGSSVLAWLIAGGMVISLALVHAELGTMFPVDGGTARFPLYGFGRVVGFLSGWFAWLSAACIAPIEAEAAIRYAANYLPWLTALSDHQVVLTAAGKLVAAGVLALCTVLNAAGIREFRETNSLLVCWKLLIPVVVACTLMALSFRTANFTVGGFLPQGAHGLLSAISTGGVIFALIGFEQAVELGGEAKNPQRAIPWAVIGAVIIGGVIYLLLQVAFIGAVPAATLANGWEHVEFPGIFGPLAGVATAVGAGALTYLIYSDAIVSPAGTALTYTATTARIPFAMAREGYLPPVLGRLSKRSVPGVALLVCYLVELGVILVFPTWDELLAFVTAAAVLVYAMAPLALGVLRRTAPDLPRPYRLRRAFVTAPLAFVVSNLILIWSGWHTDAKLFSGIAVGFVVLVTLMLTNARYRHSFHEWRAAAWVPPYIAGMALLSYLSPYGGGIGVLDSWAALAVIIGFSLAVYVAALRAGTAAERMMPEGSRPVDHWYRNEAVLRAETG